MHALTKLAFASAFIAAPGFAAAPKHELGNLLETPIGRHYTQDYVACYDETITGNARFGCATDEAQLQDKILNRTYRTLLARLATSQARKLKNSERAWIVARNHKCHTHGLNFNDYDPSDDNSPNPWCVIDESIRRNLWLKRTYP